MPIPPVRALLLAVALGACGGDSFERPGTWQPTGVNDANLRPMLADPGDLRRGASPADASRGRAASAPVTRLLEDRRAPLPAREPTGGSAHGR
ncbi:hypothetical protein [Falsiroseomonas sp. CW058]|uniref:hypothetical protein n=1 Tax=Falsiroseomonas sp. CW058 TaxID=3388664 RepID=UPI003D31B895